jgi:protein-S-isoprenylcysteine O-methyltransferase Ste14
VPMAMVYKTVFIAAIAGFLCIRAAFGVTARRAGLSADFTDGERGGAKAPGAGWLGALIVFCILFVFLFYLLFPLENNPLILPLPAWVHAAGIGACLVSLGLQIAVHKAYYDGWRRAKTDHRDGVVIQTGPYAWVRHPLYSALIVFLFGWAFLTAYLPFFLLAAAGIPFFDREAAREESAMRGEILREYEGYRRRTGRLFPRIAAGKK